MNAVINFKTDKKIKTKAQKIAKKMGLSLTDILNVYLRNFIKTEKISIDLKEEEPTEELLGAIKEAEEDYKKGDVYTFSSVDKMIEHLSNIRS